MIISKTKTGSKIVALILAATILVGMIPINLLSVSAQTAEHANVFTIMVKDNTGGSISGAAITGTYGNISVSGTTDGKGVLAVPDITDDIETNGIDQELVLSVTATGYITITNQSSGNYGAAAGDEYTNVDVIMTGNAASITTDPAGGAYLVGQTISLSVAAANAKAYQWYQNGNLISGAQNATYSKAAVLADAGTYKCVVTGTDGNNVDSGNAIIAVDKNTTAVQLGINPATGQARPDSITLRATNLAGDATGTLTFRYGDTVIGTPVNVGQTVTFWAIGEVDIYSFTVTYSGDDDQYEGSVSAAWSYSFSKGMQAALSVTGIDSTYLYGDGEITLAAIGGTTNGNITYSSSNTSVAEVTGNKVKIVGAGKFEITATMAGDNDYNPVSVTSDEITVGKREIEIDGIIAEDKEYDGNKTAALNYDAVNFNNAVPTDSLTVTAQGEFISKDVGEDIDVAISDLELDDASANNYSILSTSQTGTKANITEKDLTVTVDADQWKFYGQSNPNEYTYTAAGEIGIEKAAFTGALSRDPGEEIDRYTINKNSLQPADDTVSGFIANNYNLVYVNTNEFEIKVFEVADSATLSSNSGISADGWYRDNVTLAAPDNYEISLSNALTGNAWGPSVPDPDTAEGEDKSVTYYLKDASGAISKGKSISYNLDKTNPTAEITVQTNTWSEFLNKITFGLFFNETQTVTITSKDESNLTVNSGVNKTEYQFVNDVSEYSDSNPWTAGDSFSIDPNNKYIVYAKVTDNAGNDIIVSSDGMVIDNQEAVITLTPDTPNAKDLYNKDVNVFIAVSEPQVYSGIKTVDYKVYNGANVTQSENLYMFTNDNPTYSDLQEIWNGSITVKSTLNNSNNIIVEVTVIDNAGNTKTESISLKIDITPPAISVSFNNNNSKKTAAGRGYFDRARTATVKIKERTANFDAENATKGIVISAVDSKGNTITIPAGNISSWTTTEGAAPDDAVHQATVTYDIDANYTASIAYTDDAGNKNSAITYGSSVTPEKFTVDTNKPTGTITVGDLGVWDKLINVLTFGLWTKTSVTVTTTSSDETSPIEAVSYYKTSQTTALTESQLLALSESAWTPYQSFKVNANEQFVVYVRIVDYAKNVRYISSNGAVVDDLSPSIQSAPEITITPQQPINGIYNSNVKVDIAVSDPMTGAANYSGLKTVTYQVLNNGTETQSGTLYHFDISNPTQAQLKQAWNGTITIDKTLNNSNYVDIKVYSTDNAGNKSEKTVSIKIDITKPKIDVVYDNNTFSNGKYLGNGLNRKAVIMITERNFNNEDVKITVKKDGQPITVINNFAAVGKDSNNDNCKWQMEIDYSKYGDGDYTFDISYTDLAGNQNDPVTYNGKAPAATDTEFAIDNSKPIIEVTYQHADNDEPANMNYYPGIKTATIKVTEHNWNASDFVLELIAEDNTSGSFVAFDAPVLSGWTSVGDAHTATITYQADGRYTFSVVYDDLADNKADDVAGQVFFVDLTDPIVPNNLGDIGIESYVNGAGQAVAPQFTVTDNNFDQNKVEITLTGAKNGRIDLNGSWSYSADGRSGTYTFPDLDDEKINDDIYTLTVKATDKSGRVSESGAIEFSVNRFGSTFDLKGVEDINNGYFKAIDDIVIREINPNNVESDAYSLTLSRNGSIKELVVNSDYERETVETPGAWSEYTYTVTSANFEDDGKYVLTLKDKDTAKNENSSDNTGQSGELVSLAIDNTPPTAAISGIEENQIYSDTSKTVTIAVTDNIKLDNMTIKLNGETVKGTVVEDTDTSNKIELTISEAFNRQTLELTYTDAAGNSGSTTIEDFLINANTFVRYYQNKSLFFGSIGGGAVIILGLGAFLILRKKKKNAETK